MQQPNHFYKNISRKEDTTYRVSILDIFFSFSAEAESYTFPSPVCKSSRWVGLKN